MESVNDRIDPINHIIKKRCADCAHGRPMPDVKNLRTLFMCKALSPSVILVPAGVRKDGSMAFEPKVSWPMMGPDDECDLFDARGPSEKG